jgi:hypothetical protein
MTHDIRYKRAISIVNDCERDLKRRLSNGERRDLLKDNTPWPSDLITMFVERMVMDAIERDWGRV